MISKFSLVACSLFLTLSIQPVTAGENETFNIDLATALRLADADNTQVALAREKVIQAEAELAESKTRLIPDLTVGASYHRHDGPIQETNGNLQDVERSSSFAGLGAGAVGAGDVQVAGIGLNVDLGDAWYAPLLAKQRARAASAKSDAVRNQVLFEVAVAYYELMRSKGGLQIALEAYENASGLAEATESFAQTGEGLESDKERAAVDALVRKRDIEVARERLELASVNLAWLLRIDPAVRMAPAGSAETRMSWVEGVNELGALTDRAMRDRPELKASDAELAAVLSELEQRRRAPFLPKLNLGVSTGAFGGDSDSSPANGGDRTDISGAIYWQLKGMGLEQKAAVDQAASQYRQAGITREDVEIGIAAEVAAATVKVRHRESRLAIGRDAVERATRSYELNRSRVFENQGLPIEVLQAIQSLLSARTLYLDSVIDYNLAQFELFTAVGQKEGRTSSEPTFTKASVTEESTRESVIATDPADSDASLIDSAPQVRSPIRRTRLLRK